MHSFMTYDKQIQKISKHLEKKHEEMQFESFVSKDQMIKKAL